MSDNQNINYTLTLRDLFSKKMGSAIETTAKLDKKMDSLGNKIKGTGNALNKFYQGIAAAGATYAVVKFGKAVVESLGKYEMFFASIKTMLHGDAVAAEALNAQLTQLAKTTPFSLDDVRSASKQMLAYGYGAHEVTKNMKMLGDISAGVGAPIGDIVYLMGTLKVQNRAFTKDIYQFQGRGINVVKELAKQFKVTESAIMDMAKKGEIHFKDVQKAFEAMTAEGGTFFNLMSEQSKTVAGKLSNLGDAWEQLRINIGKSQSGIIAGTLNWANSMLDAINRQLSNENMRDNAIKNIAEDRKLNSRFKLGDEQKDRLYYAYKGSFKDGERKYFESDLERDTFLEGSGGQGWDKPGWGGTQYIGTQERFDKFSSKWYDRYNGLAGMSGDKQTIEGASFLKELTSEHAETLKLMQQGRISTKLAENQFAVIDDIFTKFKGLQRLNTIAPQKPETPGAEKKEDLGTGIDTSMHRPQNLYISIDKLIENMSINTTNLQESTGKIREEVTKVILEAVNDVNYMDGK